MNRREWAGSLIAAAFVDAPQSPRTFAVVGAGVFGAWTAFHLRSAGHKVLLVDQYGPASSRASSGGETRIIRCAYGPDEVYARMAQRSLTLWSNFFAESGGPNLLHPIGVLWMAQAANPYVVQSRQTLEKLQIPFKHLSAADLARLYPQIHLDSGVNAIFEPESGALMARQSVAAVVDRFVAHGGSYRPEAIANPQGRGALDAVFANDGQTIVADEFIFACGPWLGKIFPALLGKRIFPTMQEVLFFGIPPGDRRFSPPRMPVWIDFSDGRGMYGFPDLENRGFKVAFDLHGPVFDPDSGERFVRPQKVAEARAYVAQRFPALANSPIVDSRVCQYENTSNGDFLIDRHPDLKNVWLIGGGSGHGFKHGPAVGEYAAARILGVPNPPVEPRFSLSSKSEHQQRAVY